jgi:DNA modification methylase
MATPANLTPFYQDEAVCIYHGDCREILPFLPKSDLLLTDPPYGIGRDGKHQSTSSHGGHKGYEFMGWDVEPPDASTFALLLGASADYVIWGANYYPQHLQPSPGWLLWDKGQRIDQADGELAASSRGGPLRIFTLNRVAIAKDGAVHPTQKPEALMKWCIGFFPKARTVTDPFMGSGTTLVAAKRLGRKAIGIEREQAYCELAVERLRQSALPLEMGA